MPETNEGRTWPGPQAEADQRDMIAVAQGDDRALAALYDRHAPLLMAVASRITGRTGEAEDVLHDVFVQVWQNASDYRQERGSVATWLKLMTRSRSLDRLRTRKRLDQRAERFKNSGLLQTVVQPDEQVGDNATLRAQLARLPEEQLRVVMMSYMGGLSAREIALAVGIPVGTVKSRIAAAMAKLRQAYLQPCREAS